RNCRRPAIVISGGGSLDPADGWRVVKLDLAAERICEQLSDHGPHKLFLLRHQSTTQRRRAIDMCAVEQDARSINRRAALGGAPLPDRVEILEAEPQRIHPRMARSEERRVGKAST